MSMNEKFKKEKATLPVNFDSGGELWLREIEAHIKFLEEIQCRDNAELLELIDTFTLSKVESEVSSSLSWKENVSKIVKTFNMLPTTTRQYLSRSNIHPSIKESLNEDWKKISNDLWFSFIKVVKTE